MKSISDEGQKTIFPFHIFFNLTILAKKYNKKS